MNLFYSFFCSKIAAYIGISIIFCIEIYPFLTSSLKKLIEVMGISIFWGTLVGINFGMSSINLYGYHSARSFHNKKIERFRDNHRKQSV